MLPVMPQKVSMTPLLLLSLVFLSSLGNARGDYSCLCCYEIETPVYSNDDATSARQGYMYEFDCKAIYQQEAPSGSFQPVQFEKKVGYVLMNSANIVIQTCAGDIPKEDMLTSPSMSQTVTTPGKIVSTLPLSSTPGPSSSTLLASLISTKSTTTTGTTVAISPSGTLSTTIPPTTKTTAVPFSPSSTVAVTTTVASKSTTHAPSTSFVTSPSVTPASTTKVVLTSSTHEASTTVSPTSTTSSTTTTTTTTMSPTTLQTTTVPTTQKPHCDVGWVLYQDSCYYFHTNGRSTWDQANSYCISHGAHLSIIQSQSENSFVIGHLNSRINTDNDHDTETSTWIGGTDRDNEGMWVWRDSLTHTDTPVDGGFTFWHHGEPDSGDGDHDEDCMCMVGNKNFDWEDYKCDKHMFSVCERPVVPITTTAPAPSSTTSHTSRIPISTNLVHSIAHSTQRPDCHVGWLPYHDSCYFIHSDDRWNWHDANNYCIIHGAHLATLQSQGENSFMVAELRHRISTDHHHDTDTGIWVGATDEDAEGTWVWRDSITHTDTPVNNGFTSWYHGEPDSGDGDHDEDCMCLIGRKGFNWQDHRCDQKMFFVCERSIYYNPYSPIIG